MWTEQDEKQLKELQYKKEQNEVQTKTIKSILSLAAVAERYPEGVCFVSYDTKYSSFKYSFAEEININIRLVGFSAREFIARVLNDNTKNT